MTDRAPAPADVEAIRPSDLRKVITEALNEAERVGMTRPVTDEWVAIKLLASPALATLHAHERANALRERGVRDWQPGDGDTRCEDRAPAPADTHPGCREAWADQKYRAEFAEARLQALAARVRLLANDFDGINGHETHDRLGGKTFGGAIRHILREETR